MTRISLKEAYDNRDVIAWLVKHQDAIDEMMNILQNINPDGDLTNIVLKTGDQIIDGRKTFIGEIVAECDIIQNGAAYETHAEQIFSHNDYIVMRDGALNGLAAGSYSGLQVKKYNGSDDVRMVVDNTGIMRVGDINDEKPLTVRDEAVDMTSGALVKWDGVNQKIIAPATSVGGDANPIKIVNGIPTAITASSEIFTVNTPSGMTATIADNNNRAHTAFRVGPYVVINIAVRLQGTFSGTSGWFDVYDLPGTLLNPGETLNLPYFIYFGGTRILNSRSVFLTNGQTYDIYFYGQIIGVIT